MFRGGDGREYLNDLHSFHVLTNAWTLVDAKVALARLSFRGFLFSYCLVFSCPMSCLLFAGVSGVVLCFVGCIVLVVLCCGVVCCVFCRFFFGVLSYLLLCLRCVLLCCVVLCYVVS